MQADMYGVKYQLDSGSPLPAIHDHVLIYQLYHCR